MPLRSIKHVRRSHLYWHLVFSAIVLAVLFVLLRGLAQVLIPIAAALLISYLLDPAVSWMERRFKLSRGSGTLLLFLIALVLITAVILVVLPVTARQLQHLIDATPQYLQQIKDNVLPWITSTFDVEIPSSVHQVFDKLGADVRTLASKALTPLGGVADRLARGTAAALSAVGTLLLIPVFVFYFLPKLPEIVQGARSLIPRRYIGWVTETAREIDTVLAAWIRGMLTVMAVLALLYAVGLTIAGVKMGPLIGMLTGLLAFIPYVGVAIGAILSVVVSIFEGAGVGQYIGIGVVFVVVQALEGLVLTPYLVGEKVGLGPVGVLLALLLGGHLFGFVGILLAVPAAAALRRWWWCSTA
jgi:predicted PurR-regulated permease PerM